MRFAIATITMLLVFFTILVESFSSVMPEQEPETKLTFEQKEQMCRDRGMIIVLARDIYDYHYCIKGERPWEEGQR